VRRTFRSTGKALLLCAATTSVGFGSLGFSNNAGLASLGRVCSVGAVCSVLVACFLLPVWWRVVIADPNAKERLPRKPSKLYGAFGWRLGGKLVSHLPLRFSRRIGTLLAASYSTLARRRTEIVLANLRPVAGKEEKRWRSASRRLFRNFGSKIADLLYFESGGNVKGLFTEEGLDVRFIDQLKSEKGALLLTIHLGNWEFGAPLLKAHGVDLLVITMPEPDERMTDIRQEARRRWGIETVVIGDGAFAFIEVLKRLQSGSVVALLLDRPPESSSVEVELFGRPFDASIAPAELARASGCSLLPVVIPWTEKGYQAVILDEVEYDRAALGTHNARRQLTQEILRAFEPVIRQYPDQWFHFVPIWPDGSSR
jgi:KDO2-lipid IV(A) lauroyltransferase